MIFACANSPSLVSTKWSSSRIVASLDRKLRRGDWQVPSGPLNANQVCGRMADNILAWAIMDAWIKHVDIDFGTYHHSTPKESKAIRERAEKAFSKLLRPLYPSGAPLRILDAGCGLGFL